MSIPEIIAVAKDVLLGVAAVVTSIVAVRGLQSWRRELEGRAEFDTAKGLLKAMYKLREELQVFRSRFFTSNSEFPESYGLIGKRSAEEEAQAWDYVYKNRWRPVERAVQDFDTHTLEAEALWGDEIRTKAKVLRCCATDVYIAIDPVVSDKVSGGENFESDKKFGQEMNMRISAVKENENSLSKEIANSVANIEDFLRPRLKRG